MDKFDASAVDGKPERTLSGGQEVSEPDTPQRRSYVAPTVLGSEPLETVAVACEESSTAGKQGAGAPPRCFTNPGS